MDECKTLMSGGITGGPAGMPRDHAMVDSVGGPPPPRAPPGQGLTLARFRSST